MEAQNLIFILLFTFSHFAVLLSNGELLLPVVEDQVQTFIVHLNKPDDAKIFGAKDLIHWHTSFLPNLTLDSGKPRLLHSYHNTITGFSARLTASEVREMETMNGFLYAQVGRRMQLHTTYSPEFLGLTDWSSAWGESLYGEGVVIGVLDTGILSTHPSFRDAGMPPPPIGWKRSHCPFSDCNNKIIGAHSFVAASKPSVTDTDGHGTHVAGIAAGSFVEDAEVLGMARGLASGTAPKAHLAVYKVCSNDGCEDSDVLAGIDQAIRDGVDVLLMPFGGLPRFVKYDNIAIGTLAAVRKGIVLVASAGNLGPRKNTVSNDAPWILTAGASSIDRRVSVTVKLGNGMELDGESAYQPNEIVSSAFLPVVFPGINGDSARLNCYRGSLDDIDVRGKIVLCYSGGMKNTEKGDVIKDAGGAAMIVINYQSQGFSTLAEVHSIPASHLSYIDGRKIRSYVYLSKNSTPTAAIFFKETVFGTRPSPAVASFSSRGPSLMNGGILKPDIVAPGANILSAWPSEVVPGSSKSSVASTFIFLSGTSMAAAHVAGIVALIKSKHPQWSPAAIQSAIMTSAHAIDLDGKPIFDESSHNKSAGLFARGAGLVNPIGAMDPGLVYNIHPNDYISYICGLDYIDTRSIVHQSLIHCNSSLDQEQLNYPSISVSLGSTSRKKVTRTVTNVGEANSVYTARIDEPEGVRIDLSHYNLRFSRLNQEESYEIRFSIRGSRLKRGHVSEGKLSWISNKHVVSSPISIRFN